MWTAFFSPPMDSCGLRIAIKTCWKPNSSPKASSRGGIDRLMARLRAIEAADETCMAYPRHKPRDDATAIALTP